MDKEFINWHILIIFMEQRWRLKKKDIASKLNYGVSELSRKKPIQFDPDLAFTLLFKLTTPQKNETINSLAFQHSEDEVLLLDALKVFLIESKCIADANLIHSSINNKLSYQAIMLELLKRANTLPPKTKDSVKEVCPQPVPLPLVQEPLVLGIDGDTLPVSGEVEDVSPIIENTTVTNTDNNCAQFSDLDKYKKCLFCTRWNGNTSYAYESKSDVYGICKMYKREQISTGGTDCKNYEPDYGRISLKELVKPITFSGVN